MCDHRFCRHQIQTVTLLVLKFTFQSNGFEEGSNTFGNGLNLEEIRKRKDCVYVGLQFYHV